jgi:predicted ribosomally synthesized peptide with SipW-like signal peptide
MSHDDATPTARRRRLPAISSRARVLAAAGVAGAMLVAGSFALFSDTGTVRTTFTAGTLDLKFDAAEDGNPTPYLVSFDGGDALAPGVAVSQDLVVYNSGSVPADLAMAAPVVVNAATGTELLEDELRLTVERVGAGTSLYSGPLAGAAFANLDLGADGTTATGTVLRFTVTMDGSAGVAVAGQSVQVDFPFTATQQP